MTDRGRLDRIVLIGFEVDVEDAFLVRRILLCGAIGIRQSSDNHVTRQGQTE